MADDADIYSVSTGQPRTMYLSAQVDGRSTGTKPKKKRRDDNHHGAFPIECLQLQITSNGYGYS